MTRKTTHNETVWLYPVLSKLGVTGFESNLSGSGDSGSIDDITFLKGDEYVQETNEQDSGDADVGVAIKRFHAPPGTVVKEGDPLFEINPVRVLRDLKTAQDLVEDLRREKADLREPREAAETLLSEIETALESVRAGSNDHGTDARNDGEQVQNGRKPVADEDTIKALELDAEKIRQASAAAGARISEIEASVEAELGRIANRSAEAMYTEVRAEKDGFVTWTNTDLIGAELEEVQEAVQIAPLSEIELILSHLTIDDGTKRDQTFWIALEEMIEREAISLGNFYDNEGGSVWLKYALNPENAEIEVEESSFVENEPEYDYEDEEDELDDEIEP